MFFDHSLREPYLDTKNAGSFDITKCGYSAVRAAMLALQWWRLSRYCGAAFILLILMSHLLRKKGNAGASPDR
ncbi:hypothetical protein MCP1_10019 [Candidatus Terasakiella magnetica]|nr:hypothetical protein MCP1_10019 [Candidatus Terasakiella magnetica]